MSVIERLERKISTPDTLLRSLSLWRYLGKKIVFTNGCFDILHRGHIEYLAAAADLGDVLVIGLNSDDSVSRLKGPARPVNDQLSRSKVLAALSFVNAVMIFEEDTPINLISTVRPDILVKGGDYIAENIVGYDLVKEIGGEVIVLPFINGYSSSAIAEKISMQA